MKNVGVIMVKKIIAVLMTLVTSIYVCPGTNTHYTKALLEGKILTGICYSKDSAIGENFIKLRDISMKDAALKVERNMKSLGFENIKILNIVNGYTFTAYLPGLKYIKHDVKGDLYDLNVAICSYSSGKYLILGMPEITMDY